MARGTDPRGAADAAGIAARGSAPRLLRRIHPALDRRHDGPAPRDGQEPHTRCYAPDAGRARRPGSHRTRRGGPAMSSAEHDDARWAELAAGYSLHALEPAEEEAFITHLAGCAVCRATLDDHELVAAQLASLADDAESAAPPWSRIRPVLGPPSEATPVQELRAPGNEAPVRRLHPRHTRLLAAAAAFAALVAVGVTGWQ